MTSAAEAVRQASSLSPIEVVFACYWEYLLSAGDQHPDCLRLSDPLGQLLYGLSEANPNPLDQLLARFLAEFMCHSPERQTSTMLDHILSTMPRDCDADVKHVDGINVNNNERINGQRGNDDPMTPDNRTQAEFIKAAVLEPLTRSSGHRRDAAQPAAMAAVSGVPAASSVPTSTQISRVLYYRFLNTLRDDVRRDEAPAGTLAAPSAAMLAGAKYRAALFRAVLRESVNLVLAAGKSDGDRFLVSMLVEFRSDMPQFAQGNLDKVVDAIKAGGETIPAFQLPDAYVRDRRVLVSLDGNLATIQARFAERASNLHSATNNPAVELALMEALAPLCLVLVKLARTSVTSASQRENARALSCLNAHRLATRLTKVGQGTIFAPVSIVFQPFKWIFGGIVEWMGGADTYLETVTSRLTQRIVDSARCILISMDLAVPAGDDTDSATAWNTLSSCSSSADFTTFVGLHEVQLEAAWSQQWRKYPLKGVLDPTARTVWVTTARSIQAVLACRRVLLQQLSRHKVCLIGPSQSGKTNCFLSFQGQMYVRGTYYNTLFPSQRLCSSAVDEDDLSDDILVVDNPGMNEVSTIGYFMMSWALSRAVCVVAIGDFSSINQSSMKQLLEFVAPITTCPVLILCNKVDGDIAQELSPQMQSLSRGFLTGTVDTHAQPAAAVASSSAVPQQAASMQAVDVPAQRASSGQLQLSTLPSRAVSLHQPQSLSVVDPRSHQIQHAARLVYLRLERVLSACRQSLRKYLSDAARLAAASAPASARLAVPPQYDLQRFVFRGATLQPPTNELRDQVNRVLSHANPASMELRRVVLDMADLKRWINAIRPP